MQAAKDTGPAKNKKRKLTYHVLAQGVVEQAWIPHFLLPFFWEGGEVSHTSHHIFHPKKSPPKKTLTNRYLY